MDRAKKGIGGTVQFLPEEAIVIAAACSSCRRWRLIGEVEVGIGGLFGVKRPGRRWPQQTAVDSGTRPPPAGQVIREEKQPRPANRDLRSRDRPGRAVRIEMGHE